MGLLRNFWIPFGVPEQSPLQLRPLSGHEPVFTVFIGENGTRKSYLLREILEAAMRANKSGAQTSLLHPFDQVPQSVVAVSAIASDRFPSSPTLGDLFVHSRYQDLYTYIGPRTSKNIISRNHNSRKLLLALLERTERLSKLGPLAARLAKVLEIPRLCRFGLNVPFRYSSPSHAGPTSSLVEFVEEQRLRAKGRPSPVLDDVPKLRHASSVLSKALRGNPPLSRRGTVEESQVQIVVDWVDGLLDEGSIPKDVLLLALRTGYLVPTAATFGDLEDDALSTGQWAMFCGTLLLGLVATDEALVLVDEPESGLHPEWQRIYMELTGMALAGLKNCHVVVATHSSLVLSSLPADRSEVVSLKKLSGNVMAQHVEVPTGWDSTDVIEEVFGVESARGPVITQAFQHVLSLVAAGRGNRSQLKAAVRHLGPLVEGLPPDDPLRVTYAALMDAAGLTP